MQVVFWTHSERRKDFGLAHERRSAIFGIALHFLALRDWASCCGVVRFGARHDQQFSALRLYGRVPCVASRYGASLRAKKFAETRLVRMAPHLLICGRGLEMVVEDDRWACIARDWYYISMSSRNLTCNPGRSVLIHA